MKYNKLMLSLYKCDIFDIEYRKNNNIFYSQKA